MQFLGISLYLYYVISSNAFMDESRDRPTDSGFKNGHSYNEPKQKNFQDLNEIDDGSSKRKLIAWDSKQYYNEKLARYKKDKEKKKISLKLMNELKPVEVTESFNEFGAVRNLEDQYTRDNGYKTHAFNVLVSNNIGLIREVPDTRHKL